MLFLSFLAILASGTQAVKAGPPSERSADLSKCKQYTIQDGDTCLKVSKKNKSTYAQIVSWNRDIPSICSKMKSLIGTSICVSNPSGAFGIPINEHADPSIATAPFYNLKMSEA
ncbi:hypothetical protein FPOAC2_07552 [Fusarium poae]|uniref:hypothetical protein n=1 Tax=Fusarium poae TaxID=36050 RepID=UPI001CEB102C|nr:hypothetical protein FPOAC1_007640 [Fusarium poae]KAG8668262.1 hypothetical protein FPOAC1_007640 [Fusarium poae]